ncbi:hypothetical protein ANAPH2_01361 [Anaplasma phagocytophilum]|nr:hypothetical protein ANAPH2_01361 [Anaplasma phagocytophilum]
MPSDDSEVVDKHYSAEDESSSRGVSTEDAPGIESGVEEPRVEGKDSTGEGEAPAEAASSDVATEDKVVPAGDEALEGELGAEVTAIREALEPAASVEVETAESRVDQEKDSGDADVKDLSREDGKVSEVTDPDAKREDHRDSVSEATEYSTRPDDPDGDKSDLRPETLDPDIRDGSAVEDIKDEVRSSRGSESTYSEPSEDSEVIDKHYSGDDESSSRGLSTEDAPGIESGVEEPRVEGKDSTGEGEPLAEAASSDVATEDKVVPAGNEALGGELGAEGTAAREALEPAASVEVETAESRVEKDSGDGADVAREREVVSEITEPSSRTDDLDGDRSDLRPEKSGSDLGDRGVEGDSKHEVGDESPAGMVSTEDVPGIESGVEASRVEGKDYTVEGEPLAEVASTDVATEDKVVSAGDKALEGELGVEVTAVREALEPAASVELETAESRVERERDIGDAAVKDLPREEGKVSEVTDPDAKRDYQEKDGDTAKELPREVVSEITEPSSRPDDQEGDRSDLRPETLDPDISDGSAIEDEVEVRSSKKTLLMRKEQVEASVLSAATKDMASEALKSGKEEDVVRDASSKVAAPIEDRGLLKTENNVTAAAQKQSDTDTLEPFSGTSSDKKKAKKGDAGKSKKKPKRKEGQPSGVSTHEILKGILSTMTSENISHQDKSLPEKEQEQDASKETHQDEKKKSQEKEREEKAQKQKSSISKMQRKISKLKSRIAQGNLTEDEIQVLKNKIAEIEADINGLDS